MKIFIPKMKLYKRTDTMEFKRTPWFHLFPFVVLFGEDAENRFTKLAGINIGWLFWEFWFHLTKERLI